MMSEQYESLMMEMEAILDASNDNIVIADSDGIILKASKNCKEIYGYDSNSIIGKSAYELEKQQVFSPSVTLAVIKKKKKVQLMQRNKDGGLIMATGIPIFNKKGILYRIVSFSHDLTELKRLKEDYEHLQQQLKQYEVEIQQLKEKEIIRNGMVIKSKNMQHAWELTERVAASDANVVLLGESGVGKTVFARALHQNSERKACPFIEVNCGAIPSSLFESEMFGYESGAFTGANHRGRKGLIEQADKGTLFLDEVGELPLDIQTKLLKVLQEKQITRLGGGKTKKIDFRLVVATNQDLKAKVKNGTFREDLFYRLYVIPITIPPLRERKEDIYSLLKMFLDRFNEQYYVQKSFNPKAIDYLSGYDWPGNVRELENFVERLVVTSPTDIIHVNEDFSYGIHTSETPVQHKNSIYLNQDLTLKEALAEVEKHFLLKAAKENKTTYDIAKELEMSQATVVRRLHKYQINSKMN